MLPILSIVHPLVDACSLCVLMAGGMSWERVLAYNFIAFALQLPMGVALDARPGAMRAVFAAGTGLVCVCALAAAFGARGWCVLAAACLGNALFHLSAGKHVLDVHRGRSGPIGLFISTGALGLLAGRLGMERCAAAALPSFAVALAACALAASTMHGWRAAHAAAMHPARGGCIPSRLAAACVLAGLFALVAWRSRVGLEAHYLTLSAGAAMMFAGAAATWLGKVAGGCLAEIAGRWRVLAASVCASALLAWGTSPDCMPAWLATLLVAQLATGPALSLVYDMMGCRGGSAFGLNCLGLFAGSVA